MFLCLPAIGARKSLTFELDPYTSFDRLFGEDCNAIVLVMVPLISLMKDQVSNLNSSGIRASSVGDYFLGRIGCERQTFFLAHRR